MSCRNECFSVGVIDLGSDKVKIVVASCSSALAAEFRMLKIQETTEVTGTACLRKNPFGSQLSV